MQKSFINGKCQYLGHCMCVYVCVCVCVWCNGYDSLRVDA